MYIFGLCTAFIEAYVGCVLYFFLQFVYLRDNLLSSLEGIEILKRVKVHLIFFILFNFSHSTRLL